MSNSFFSYGVITSYIKPDIFPIKASIGRYLKLLLVIKADGLIQENMANFALKTVLLVVFLFSIATLTGAIPIENYAEPNRRIGKEKHIF